jgi:hypothetical protein
MQDVNPLEVLNKRVLDFMPKHFSKTCIGEVNSSEVHQWVRQNLRGRFCVVNYPSIDSKSGRLKHMKYVGFEDPKEMLYFMLACPYNRRD